MHTHDEIYFYDNDMKLKCFICDPYAVTSSQDIETARLQREFMVEETSIMHEKFRKFFIHVIPLILAILLICYLNMVYSILKSNALNWYQEGSVFIIDASSIVNSDDIEEKIEYIQKLGVKTVVLSSLSDVGDKIIGNQYVDLINGESMKYLIKTIIDEEMKVVFEINLNHASIIDMFFNESARNNRLSDPIFPTNNNWLSVTGKSAWKWSHERKTFYLHQYSEKKAVLNFRNTDVVNFFERMFEFLLYSGIHGFYLNNVQCLFEDNLPKTKELLSRWGNFIKDIYGVSIVTNIDAENITGVSIVHNPITLPCKFTGEQLLHAIISKISKSPSAWPSWEWICSEVPNCWESEIIDAFRILSSLLPGTPFIYADTKHFKNNRVPNITLIESTLKEIKKLPVIENGSFNVKQMNSQTVFAFHRASVSDNILYAWNLSNNVTIINLRSFDRIPAKLNLTLCTTSACSILPPLQTLVDSSNLRLAAESAVVLKF